MKLLTPVLSAPFRALLSIFFLFGAFACQEVTPPPASPPNVILVVVDDLGWQDLSIQGSKKYETPHIDQLAQGGMRFTDAYAACAVCSPSRAALMTGRYPVRYGVTDWIRSRFQGGEIPEDNKNPQGFTYTEDKPLMVPENALWLERREITLAEWLKPAGYTSAHIGKWHLGPDDWYPTRQGFDENYGGCDYGQPPSYFDPYSRPEHAHPMIQAGIPTLTPRDSGEYLTDREGDEAVAFIERNAQQGPFFLYLAHYAVHTPIQAKDSLTAAYEAKLADKGGHASYAAMIASVDEAMGKILATLKKEKLEENTLILFTSDNGGLDQEGWPTDNAPLRSGKGYPYEGGIRVPFIAYWPGTIAAGQESSRLVTGVDVFPTLAEIAGLDLPPETSIDGYSLWTHFKKGAETAVGRGPLFWHFPHYRGRDVAPYSIIREGKWKLIRYYDGTPTELYDLENDLGESRNLATDEINQVRMMETRLDAWLLATSAKVPRAKPAAN
ncbi:MAG: sulfatase [Bacteroidota bacterium]